MEVVKAKHLGGIALSHSLLGLSTLMGHCFLLPTLSWLQSLPFYASIPTAWREELQLSLD